MSIFRPILDFLKKVLRMRQEYASDAEVFPPLQQEEERQEEEEIEEEEDQPQDDDLPKFQNDEELWAVWSTLTRREREVAAMICVGFSYFEVGRLLSFSEATAKSHAASAQKKFSVHNRGQLQAILLPKKKEFEAWARKRFGDDLIDRWKLWGQLDI